MTRSKRRSCRRERGTVTILVAIALMPLIGILALAIDYGNCVVAQTALQNYVDAKSLAHLKEEFGLPVDPVQINGHVPFQTGATEANPVKGAWDFATSDFTPFTSVLQPGDHLPHRDLPLLATFVGVVRDEKAVFPDGRSYPLKGLAHC